jgi:signal transduction histidine kinase
VVGAATVARDITGRERADEHRHPLEVQLQQAELMSIAGQLASGIAHDFKNLLGIVVGYAERAAEIERSPEVSRMLGDIRLAADRAVHLSDSLLAFGPRTRGEPEPVDLNALIANSCELLRVAVGGQAKLCLNLSPVSLPAVLADSRQLEQLLLNLALNARDAMSEGGTLTIGTSFADFDEHQVRLHPGTGPGGCVVLDVTDTGTGMTEDTAARIFDRYFTTKPDTGTGLGLVTVQTAVADAGALSRWTPSRAQEPHSASTFQP